MDERKRILIIEDDDGVRSVYRFSLQMHGFDVHDAGTGYEALRLLDTFVPDLILLDWGLRDLSGLAVHQELSERATTRHIPIVIVTAADEELSHVKVACVLRKPVLSEELVTIVRRCLSMSDGTHTDAD
jgi:two-component system phosphate regulon response regulator PhoB